MQKRKLSDLWSDNFFMITEYMQVTGSVILNLLF